jgi:DEAD/DEAH box helicase domain-containing protein
VTLTDPIDRLRDDNAFMRDVAEWRHSPARQAAYGRWPSTLDTRVVAMFDARGISQPYTHQAEAVTAVLNGQDTVVVASAAGGKSVCFHAPILDALIASPAARALCLFPTKALAQDQLALFAAETDRLGMQRSERKINPVETYDGDTPQARRGDIRRDARVIVSNFDMLHIGILPHHARWAALFKNLRYVVIDEMHSYSGIFGSHVANVIRRLRRICQFYGTNPVFVLASATIANPKAHAERLIEAPVRLVDQDGSPHGDLHVLMVNPPLTDPDLGLRRSADFVVRDIASRLIGDGLQTIAFTRSRNATEVLLTYLRERVSRGEAAPKVVGYRGGYLADERRAIEAGLRSGAIRGVVSTNALELGIDIGRLDACVLHGYPGSIASFWQQTGRAGRRQQAAVAVMVATADPLDQYLVSHPEFLFAQSPEQARIAPDNLGVLAAHTACAAFELPFERGETLGTADVGAVLEMLAEDGDVFASGGPPATSGLFDSDGARGDPAAPSAAPTRFTWIGERYPADRVSLRGIGERVSIVNEGDNALIGETELSIAASRVHPGAIYLHQGQPFVIVSLDWDGRKAVARPVDSDHFTQPSTVAEVEVLTELGGERQLVAAGEIEVTRTVTRYRQIQFATRQTLGWGEVNLPPQTLLTSGYWFSLSAGLTEALSKEGILGLPNDYGPNWAKQRDAARARDGYKCVVCGVAEQPHRQHDVHHRKPFRTFGYKRGENEAYLQANALDNLMTVCTECHSRVETAERVNHAMSGLCNLMGNLAPLYVMCDRGDLFATWEIESRHTKLPTVTIYEAVPGGTGIAEVLREHHYDLLRMAAARVRECPCERGCPACIGPVESPGERHPKQDTLKLIAGLMSDTLG